MSRDLLIWYDDYHTPVADLVPRLQDPVVLDVDLGGAAQRAPTRQAAVHYVDAVEEYAERYVLSAIKAQARYQAGYALSAALSRPLIAQHAASVAASIDAQRIVHGYAGNDQLRVELALRVLAPHVAVVAAADLLGSQNQRNDGQYTVSDNLWGRSSEAADLSDVARVAPRAAFERSCGDTAQPERHGIEFDEGRPVALDGDHLPLVELIVQLDECAGSFGIGAIDMVEDGFVGLKGRAVYEAPAATVLLAAHADLQWLVTTRRQAAAAVATSIAWTDLVYDGLWFDPARESMEALLDDVNRYVTGEVTVLFSQGAVTPIARTSPHALYDDARAIYRVGQDVVANLGAVADALAAPMQIAHERKFRQRKAHSWNA